MNNYYYVIVDDDTAPKNPVTPASLAEYRHGNSPSFYPIKMPGLGKVGNVVVENALLPTVLFDRLKKQIGEGDHSTSPLSVFWYDADGGPHMVWKLDQAFPHEILEGNSPSDGYTPASMVSLICHGIEGLPL